MKFLVTTALSAGVALVAAGAHAQTTLEVERESVTVDETNADAAARQRDLLDPDVIEEHEEQAIEEEIRLGTEAEKQGAGGMGTPQPMEETAPDSRMDEPGMAPIHEEGSKPSGQDTTIMEAPTYVVVPPAEEKEPKKKSGPGVSITAGGGVFGFSDGAVNDVADVGGAYSARLGVGTRSLISLELAYEGTAQNIDAIGLDRSSVLLSNGVEGDLRFNMGTAKLQPYVFGGAAWKRYDIVNDDFNQSAIRDNDDVVEFPVGGGLAFRSNGLVLDARGAYRFATDQDLFPGDVNLNNWQATLRAGVEF